MRRKILREIDTVIVPITITVALRRFALCHSKRFPGCPRPEVGSTSHYFNFLSGEYVKKTGIKAEGLSRG